MPADDVSMDPAAVEAAAGKLRDSGSLVAQHGNDLDVATSGARIGRGGALATEVERLAKEGLSSVARDVTQAIKRVHDDTADGLERAAKRVRTDDEGAGKSFDDLGHESPGMTPGSPLSVIDDGSRSPTPGPSTGGRGRSPSPVPTDLKGLQQNKPKHSPDIKKWQASGGTISVRRDGSVKYTSGAGHVDKLPKSMKDQGITSVSVTYDKRGNPNFTPFLDHKSGIKSVHFTDGYSGDRGPDFSESNKLAAGDVGKDHWLANGGTTGGKSPKDYTWHHHHDLHTMQLVPRKIHELFPHFGGVSLLNNQ